MPKHLDKRKQVLQSVCQSLGILPKLKAIRKSTQAPDSLVKKIQEFYLSESISWQASGKRDTKTVKENGVKVKLSKASLVQRCHNIHDSGIER